MKINKEIIKGEIGNVGGYPVFELIVDEKLKRVVLLDDVQKVLDKALFQQRKEIMKDLKRIKLDIDVSVCDCGEPYKNSDVADLVNEALKKYKKSLK